MGQFNRGPSFNSATIDRARGGERRLSRREPGSGEDTAPAGALPDNELVGMPPPVPSWPRVFPGL